MSPETLQAALKPEDSSALATFLREFYLVTLDDSGRAIINTISLAFLGVLILRSAYSLIKTDWPETYTDTETRAQEHIRANPIRTYVIFRGGPVFLVSVFISVCVDRAGGDPWWGLWLMIGTYLVWTTGKACFEVVRKPRHPNWTMLLIYHLLSVIVVLASGVTAVAIRSLFAPIVPDSRELLISIWAGIFAALLAGVTRQILAPQRLEGHQVVVALRKDIGTEAWSYIRASTASDQLMQNFVLAHVLAEAQQRPRWFRRLERFGGRIWGSGTYGVAQVAADRPISDKESIDLLVERLDNEWVRYSIESGAYSREFNDVCLELNNDAVHASRVQSFYSTIAEMRETGTLPC
ncbi:hypothetical protein CGUA_00215 [Corynebacterium guangdongense]|nr:hypothetical protein CGUA_00215 [Corynebacterium guangdongense]